jgi:hypothetical protein
MPIIKFFMKHALLFYLIVSISIAIFLVAETGLWNQFELANHGSLVKGSVVKPQCDRHLSFIYQFVLDDVTYRGESTSDECRQIKSGDPVLVYYLAENPKISIATDPNVALANNSVAILIASLTAPLVLLLIFWYKLRASKKSENLN